MSVPSPAGRRRVGARVVDRIAGRLMGLRPATTGYTVTTGLRVPMRDGVTLAADLYRPTKPSRGTLLARTPYSRVMPYSLQQRIFAERGYTVLLVSSRGTFGSGGEFDPMRTEAQDGQDVVAWLLAQPWFTGSFATIGASYLGYTQWALLVDPPSELVAAVVPFGPHDYARHAWGTGAMNLDLLMWSDLIAHQESNRFRVFYRAATSVRRLKHVIDAVPLAGVAERYFDGRARWYRKHVTRPDLTDPFWAPTRHGTALERTDVPVLLIGGWHDIFLGQTIEQYRRLHARGVEVALTVGPWTHIDLGVKAMGLCTRETLDWLDEHLARDAARRRSSPVRVYVSGAEEWRNLPAWPPPTVAQHWYPAVDGGLARSPAAGPAGSPAAGSPAAGAPSGGASSKDAPSTGTPTSSFTFDPADPTPTVGSPIMSGGGRVDDSGLAARPDVLTFTSAPLTADVEVTGPPRVELAHDSDNPHVDVFVRLSEVDTAGRSSNVTEGYRRLPADRPAGTAVVDLRDTAHRFVAGSRIRLLIAGGSHPQYGRNLGTGENPGTGERLRPATHVITHGESTRLTLPVAVAAPAR
jgi:putative CocE/NonD family hydrolase